MQSQFEKKLSVVVFLKTLSLVKVPFVSLFKCRGYPSIVSEKKYYRNIISSFLPYFLISVFVVFMSA